MFLNSNYPSLEQTRIDSREFELAEHGYESVDDKVAKLAARMRRLNPAGTAAQSERVAFGDLGSIGSSEAVANRLKDLSHFLRVHSPDSRAG